MSDARSRYERWTSEQRLEELVKLRRIIDDGHLHKAAIKQELERSQLYTDTKIREIDRALDGDYLKNLILVIWQTLEAGDPRSSAPIENTMRVSHPDSSVDEGASTRRFRKLSTGTKASLQFHLNRVTEIINNNLDRDPERSAVRREAAFYRHHKDGKHQGEPREGCPDCEREAS